LGEKLPQTGPRTVQTGFDRAEWIARNLMNFLEFVPLGVMQQDDESVFVTELGKRLLELHYVIQPFRIAHRIQVSGQRFNALAGKLTLFDADQARPCEAPPIVDEVVVHDAAQPGARLPYFEQVVEARECLEQNILEKILSLCLRAGKSISKAVQAVKMRPQQGVEACALVVLNGIHAGRV